MLNFHSFVLSFRRVGFVWAFLTNIRGKTAFRYLKLCFGENFGIKERGWGAKSSELRLFFLSGIWKKNICSNISIIFYVI